MSGPSSTSNSLFFNILMSIPTNHSSYAAMSGRTCSSSNCPGVRPFTSLTPHPQKCTSLFQRLNMSSRRRRLDIGCGKHTLTTHFSLWPLPYSAGSAYWILECAKQWRVSCPSILSEAGAQSNLAVGPLELRVCWRVHSSLRANHDPHLAQDSI